MLQMRSHPSKHAEVEAHLDRLLGRKQALDPDFADMRRDERFRELIAKMCEGTNDANCVYGAQRENREQVAALRQRAPSAPHPVRRWRFTPAPIVPYDRVPMRTTKLALIALP